MTGVHYLLFFNRTGKHRKRFRLINVKASAHCNKVALSKQSAIMIQYLRRGWGWFGLGVGFHTSKFPPLAFAGVVYAFDHSPQPIGNHAGYFAVRKYFSRAKVAYKDTLLPIILEANIPRFDN